MYNAEFQLVTKIYFFPAMKVMRFMNIKNRKGETDLIAYVSGKLADRYCLLNNISATISYTLSSFSLRSSISNERPLLLC